MTRRKKILVAPINWGIGHATRCIPVIQELLKQGADVVIAGDGRSFTLLQKEFPQLEFYRLKGYDITYQHSGSIFLPIIKQLPKLIRSIQHEHRELDRIIHDKKIDAVISDNRFGLYSNKVPCIFITHQVSIIMPPVFKWMEKAIIYRLNKRLIERFTHCWIPDFAGDNNLSGRLTRKYPLPNNAQFIDPLSRFQFIGGVQKKYDVLAILSGPEPQRTILEKILLEQLKPLPVKALLVRGVPEQNETTAVTNNLSVVSFLNAEQLNEAILASGIVVSRSGYSTVMDLAVLGAKAIFIPTPGQTEQEYLAKRFKEEGVFYSEVQVGFDLQRALKEAVNYRGLAIEGGENNVLKEKLGKLLNQT